MSEHDEKNTVKSIKSPKWLVFLFIISIIWGFYLRIYQLDHQSYWLDESFTVNAALEIMEKGYPLLDSGQPYKHGLINTYVVAATIKTFGYSHWATRISSVFWGLGVVIIIFLLAKRLFDPLTAFISGLLVNFSLWEIAWSRQARMYAQLQFFYFFSLYLFLRFLDKPGAGRLTWLIAATMGAIFSHSFGFFLLPIYLIYAFIWHRRMLGEKIKFIFKRKNWSIQNYLLAGVIILSLIWLLKLSVKTWDTVSNLASIKIDTYLTYQAYSVELYHPLLLAALVGVALALFKQRVKQTWLLLIGFLLPYISILIISYRIEFRYLFFIFPIILILASYFLTSFFKSMANLTRVRMIQKISGALAVLAAIIFIILSPQFIYQPKNFFALEKGIPQPNYRAAYDFIKNHADFTPDAIILSPLPAMDKVYGLKTNYWLPISLTRRTEDFYKQLTPDGEREIYTNTPLIKTAEDLAAIINNNHGFIWLDQFSWARLPKDYRDLIQQQELVFLNTNQKDERVWVVKF